MKYSIAMPTISKLIRIYCILIIIDQYYMLRLYLNQFLNITFTILCYRSLWSMFTSIRLQPYQNHTTIVLQLYHNQTQMLWSYHKNITWKMLNECYYFNLSNLCGSHCTLILLILTWYKVYVCYEKIRWLVWFLSSRIFVRSLIYLISNIIFVNIILKELSEPNKFRWMLIECYGNVSMCIIIN